MRHCTHSEIHEIAILTSIIMPFLCPKLVYHEEGYYIQDRIMVSHDGSLREDGEPVFAFENKAPMPNIHCKPVHFEVHWSDCARTTG